ncbi:hypothetical protein CONCODRAFT_3544 [Conidiobolus coronatus NRRL 28638]|uniref:Uncharacterized protein n=1 Tax=Conidiobolus coronatus (strain ATCC 28846 / CBS 209.66 / NRRL 28638) TaxID=796925 RepID=A0A137PEQ2_CONC2|nr:hypothetical protein CONCODRAFT_3544 [Conidiobolus coronatus NRRL 28638]|eukprot:KXN73445.1 hypothetical protein CONCODRAFT_3544 [Conidiobolus coronatus NRRL 28638]
MDLAVVVRNNNELAAAMLKPFTDSLGRTLLFKMTAQAPSVTFNQIFESALKSITLDNQAFKYKIEIYYIVH